MSFTSAASPGFNLTATVFCRAGKTSGEVGSNGDAAAMGAAEGAAEA
nr:hypothetical protein [uncultured bacterium]